MDEASFRAELRRMANANGIPFLKEDKILQALHLDLDGGADFVNIFRGSQKSQFLIVTSVATHSLVSGMFSVKTEWRITHEELRTVRVGRQSQGGYIIDLVALESSNGRNVTFWVGFNDRRMGAEMQMAKENAHTAAEEIEAASRRTSHAPLGAASGLSFDPQGPEKAGESAKRAYSNFEWSKSLELYVTAMDRLHDFYVFEQFRNRQPSPADAWLIEGLISALGITRDRQPDFDVRELVRTATHRLRTIATSLEGAGGNAILYRRGLDGLAQYAPDVEVGDIFWT